MSEAHLLVPFSGAGSEVIGGLRAGWSRVTGIEREAKWVDDAMRRIVRLAPRAGAA
jgi:site-specific DNA-methyltransferase (adenine-specific)